MVEAWERRIPRPLNCFQKQRVGYRVAQGFVSRNASRNTRGRVPGEVLLVPLISYSNEATGNPYTELGSSPVNNTAVTTNSWENSPITVPEFLYEDKLRTFSPGLQCTYEHNRGNTTQTIIILIINSISFVTCSYKISFVNTAGNLTSVHTGT